MAESGRWLTQVDYIYGWYIFCFITGPILVKELLTQVDYILEWSVKIKVGNFKWQGVENVPNMNIKYGKFFSEFLEIVLRCPQAKIQNGRRFSLKYTVFCDNCKFCVS